jgi:hypothetical protein
MPSPRPSVRLAAPALVLVLAGALGACGSDDEPAAAPDLPAQLCDVVTTTPLPGWTFTVDDQSTSGDDAQRTATCSMSDADGSTVTIRLDAYGDDGDQTASARADAAYDDACTKIASEAGGTPTRTDDSCELVPSGLPAGQAAASGVLDLGFLPGLATVDVTTTEARKDDAVTLVKTVRLTLVSELG